MSFFSSISAKGRCSGYVSRALAKRQQRWVFGPRDCVPIRQLTELSSPLMVTFQLFRHHGYPLPWIQRSALRSWKQSSMTRFQSVGFRPQCGVCFIISCSALVFPPEISVFVYGLCSEWSSTGALQLPRCLTHFWDILPRSFRTGSVRSQTSATRWYPSTIHILLRHQERIRGKM